MNKVAFCFGAIGVLIAVFAVSQNALLHKELVQVKEDLAQQTLAMETQKEAVLDADARETLSALQTINSFSRSPQPLEPYQLDALVIAKGTLFAQVRRYHRSHPWADEFTWLLVDKLKTENEVKSGIEFLKGTVESVKASSNSEVSGDRELGLILSELYGHIISYKWAAEDGVVY